MEINNQKLITPDVQHEIEIFNKTIQFLESFDDADELAAYFKVQGIKAVIGCADACVIADYINQNVLSEKVLALVETYSVGLMAAPYTVSESHVWGSVVRSFIIDFDNGIYPDLVRQKKR